MNTRQRQITIAENILINNENYIYLKREEERAKRKEEKEIRKKAKKDLKKLNKTRFEKLVNKKYKRVKTTGFKLKELVKLAKKNKDKKFLISFGNIFYELNEETEERLTNQHIKENEFGSDNTLIEAINNKEIGYITIVEKKEIKRDLLEGGFFDKLVSKKFYKLPKFKKYFEVHKNLSNIGVYSKFELKNYNGHCFSNALKMLNLDEDKLKLLHFHGYTKGAYLPKSKLNEICEFLEIHIKLREPKNTNTYYPKNKELKFNRTYELGLINKHYFPVLKVSMQQNTFAIMDYLFKNPEYLKDISKEDLIKIPGIKEDESKIELNKYNDTIFDKHYKIVEIKDKKEEKLPNINIFFDVETRKQNNKSILTMTCAYYKLNNEKKRFCELGELSCYYFLKSLKEQFYRKNHITLIAHNAKFDYSFIFKHLTNIEQECELDNSFIFAKGSFYGLRLTIKDSLKIIAEPLSKFGEMFKLEQKKEIFDYNVSNNKTIDELLNISLEEIDPKIKESLIQNAKEWKCLKKNSKIDYLIYTKNYCMLDCEVLMNGYNYLQDKFKNIFNIDIDNFYTIGSIADRYFFNEGCFTDTYTISGIPMLFISQAARGGRTMSNNNLKYDIQKPLTMDDLNSLYPSAENRMEGYMKGKPKIIQKENLNYNYIQQQDFYFVEILITKVNQNLDFPLLDKTNDIANKYYIVDKITLEDLIMYQKIEFNILQGFYFNDGFNINIKEKIQYVYNERLKLKNEKNPSQIIYKLIMNAGYGKLLNKARGKKTRLFNNKEDLETFIWKNRNSYIEGKIISENNKEEKTCYKGSISVYSKINNHSNRVHQGSYVLSMSKRIVNEIFVKAQLNDIKIFYQDTDSWTFLAEDRIKFETLFPDLYGKKLGQAKDEFDGKTAKRGIFGAPKTYCFEFEDSNKTTTKGINKEGFAHTCKLLNKTPIQLFELMKTDIVNFDLTAEGKKYCIKYDNQRNIIDNILHRKINIVGDYLSE